MQNLITAILIFGSICASVQADDDNQTTPRKINILIIMENEYELIRETVSKALQTIKQTHPGQLGSAIVIINGTNQNESINILTKYWDQAIGKNSTKIPDIVLDVCRSGSANEVVLAFTAALGIPTLAARHGDFKDLRIANNIKIKDDQMQYLIQINPLADLLPWAIRELCSTLNISNAAIIFDSHFIMDHHYKSLLLNIPTRHVIIPAKFGRELEEQMAKLRRLDLVNYFILGSSQTICQYLRFAQIQNLSGRKYGWFSFTLDLDFTYKCQGTIPLLSYAPKFSSAQFKQLKIPTLLPKPYLPAIFYYDFIRLGFLAMSTAVNEDLWLTPLEHISSDQYNGNNTPIRDFDLFGVLENVTSRGIFKPTADAFKFTINQEHAKKTVQITDFVLDITSYNNSEQSDLKHKIICPWKAGPRAPLNTHLVTDDVVNHPAVVNFRVVTVPVAPFVEYDDETGEWSGYCIDLLNEIRKLMYFDYEIYEAPDGEFGAMNETDYTWNGVIGELVNKNADIAIGTISVMAERENVVDFTVPYYDLVGLSILMAKPKPPKGLFKFLTVLENEVWLCILGIYFFSSLLMWIFDRWSPFSYQNNLEKYRNDEEKRLFDLRECLWFCMTSLTPQGGGDSPKNFSGRVVAAVWWLFGFIIIASYTANLAAFLTVSRLEAPIESLEDLSKQYKIQYAPVEFSEAYTYFERMTNIEKRFYQKWESMVLDNSMSDQQKDELAVWEYPLSNQYTKMFDAMKEAGFPKDKEEAIERVRRQISDKSEIEFAFIGDATEIKYLSMTQCDLLMVGDEFSRKPYAIAVQQGSPLKDLLNNAILKLLNQRDLEKLKNKWWTDNPKRRKCDEEDDANDGISIQNIGGVFIVIFVGIILACMTLAFEYWYYRNKPEQAEKNQQPSKVYPAKDKKPFNFILKLRSDISKNSELRSRF